MTKTILENINNSIPENIKLDLTKRIVTRSTNFINFSNELKQMANNNFDIRNYLFKNDEIALYFAGDILAKTLYNFWIKGGKIEEHFIENAQITSYHAGFECLWN
jgi:hypothetical protein